jgi:RNA polymerase sigma-70 factor (ECF subfamily)
MEEIIKRFRDGDQSSFEKLFTAFFSSGRSFVLSFLIDEDSADDILQEVFIHIWNKRKSFNNESHFKAYFYKSLRNNTVKRIIRSKHPVSLDSIGDEKSEDLFIKITEIEFKREITRAVALLPERRRQIILLSMAGMSAEQIAGALNITVNTVKNQKTKAYTTLRQELKDISTFVFLLGL